MIDAKNLTIGKIKMTPNTRKPEETFEQYKARLNLAGNYKKPYRELWDSSVKPKTYIRSVHGEL